LNCRKRVFWDVFEGWAGLKATSHPIVGSINFMLVCYLASDGGLGAFPCSGDDDLIGEGDLKNIGDVAATKMSRQSVS